MTVRTSDEMVTAQPNRYKESLAKWKRLESPEEVKPNRFPPIVGHFLFAVFFITCGAILFPMLTPVKKAPPQMASAPTPTASPASSPVPSNDAPAPSIAPTVTPEMGDVGGKFFGKAPDPARTRHYYIAAEPELWNFAPEGEDPVCGKGFPESLLLNRSSWKIRYIQYADPNFSARVLPANRLGIMGPVLRGTVGDYIEVTFLNRAWMPLSMHPHGVKYDKDSEGSYYKDGAGLGAAIAPGAKFTYVWKIDADAAPLPDEPSSKAWLYHSHVSGDEETNLGLIGSIIVTDPARARPDGTPRDVDREMAALFMIFDESSSFGDAVEEPDERPAGAPQGPVQRTWAETAELTEASQRHTINGLTFGNLPGLEMNEGERVRWYLFGMGSESDLHAAHWHGMTVVEDARRRTDVVELLPASMRVADMVADNPGTWLFHCHVADHMSNGMFACFTVHPAGGSGISRDPEVAFFGMPQSLNTLRIQSAELALDKGHASTGEIDLTGQVTVPTPFPVARNAFSVKIGGKTLTLQPDASGICSTPEGLLLIKNISSFGVVTGGTMNFELTLKGAGWLDQLREQHLLQKDLLVSNATMPLSLLLGSAQHSASAILKPAIQ